MKYFNLLIITFFVISGCGRTEKSTTSGSVPLSEMDYEYFGKRMDDGKSESSGAMFATYGKMAISDTFATKFSARVTDVCKVKGCWMKLELGQGEEAMVKFKDYGFFMPKDIVGREVIVDGLAYIEEMGVDDQRHFAEDGGKSPEDIAQITAPKRTYLFIAEGVLLKK